MVHERSCGQGTEMVPQSRMEPPSKTPVAIREVNCEMNRNARNYKISFFLPDSQKFNDGCRTFLWHFLEHHLPLHADSCEVHG